MCSGVSAAALSSGSLVASGISCDSGSEAVVVIGWRSSASDCTAPYSIQTAMNDSSKVLMTSLVPAFTLSTPAMPPHSPPASAAASIGTMKDSGAGKCAAPPYRLTAVAAMPPSAIWPSPPTLVRLARCASTKPMPTRPSASARLIDAATAYGEPQAPSANAATACGIDTPIASTRPSPHSIANSTAATEMTMAGRSLSLRATLDTVAAAAVVMMVAPARFVRPDMREPGWE